jgi:hypothetical protein
MTGEPPPLPPSVFTDVAKAISPTVTPRSTYRQCRKADGTEKQRYPNEVTAWLGVRALVRSAGYVHNPKRPLRAYKCPWCRKWHIGKLPEPKKNP